MQRYLHSFRGAYLQCPDNCTTYTEGGSQTRRKMGRTKLGRDEMMALRFTPEPPPGAKVILK